MFRAEHYRRSQRWLEATEVGSVEGLWLSEGNQLVAAHCLLCLQSKKPRMAAAYHLLREVSVKRNGTCSSGGYIQEQHQPLPFPSRYQPRISRHFPHFLSELERVLCVTLSVAPHSWGKKIQFPPK